MTMSEEQRKAAGERLRAGKAAKAAERAAGVIADPETPSVSTPKSPRALKRLNTRRGGRRTSVLRGIKMVQPACMVVDEAHDQPTTGPCQQAAHGDPAWGASWFLHCTHGDESLDPKDRPYYEVSFELRETEEYLEDENGDLVATGKVEKKKIKHRMPRITQVAAGRGSMSGQQLAYATERGCRPLSDFDIAPMCEYWNCWSQNGRQFQNGFFCSEQHARLIKAVETGVVLALPWEGLSAERREQQLASLAV